MTKARELWDRHRIAAELGIKPHSVSRTLARWGVSPVVPQAGRRAAQYLAADVRRAARARPGRGNRAPRE